MAHMKNPQTPHEYIESLEIKHLKEENRKLTERLRLSILRCELLEQQLGKRKYDNRVMSVTVVFIAACFLSYAAMRS